MPTPLIMPKRRVEHPATPLEVKPGSVPGPAPKTTSETGAVAVADPEDDLPECMRPGWDPLTPAREAQRRYEDACIAEGVQIEYIERF